MEFDTSTRLKDLAAEAATAFLDRGVPLTQKIATLCERADMNAEQATRVCEFANHAVWQAMRKHASTVEFPIAEPEKVRRLMGHDEKVAMVAFRSNQASRQEKTAADKGIGTENGRQLDEWESREARQNAEIAHERAKVAMDEATDRLQGRLFVFDDAMDRFAQFCKEAAMDGADMDEVLFHAVSDKRVAKSPELAWKMAYLIKAASLLAERPVVLSDRTMAALEPAALEKAAQEVEMDHLQPGLHMAGMPVQMVNGRHQAFREIDTLAEEWGEVDALRRVLDNARNDFVHTKEQVQNGIAIEASRAGGSV